MRKLLLHSNLSVRSGVHYSGDILYSNTLKKFIEQQSQLENLTLKVVVGRFVQDFLPATVSLPLKKLKLFSFENHPTDISDFLKNCKTTLNDFSFDGNLSDSSLTTVMNELQLKKFTIGSNHIFFGSQFNQCSFSKTLNFRANHSIESFDFGLIFDIPLISQNGSTFEILKKLPNLKKISLRGLITAEMLSDIEQNMPKLEEIELSFKIPLLKNFHFPTVKSLTLPRTQKQGVSIVPAMSEIVEAFPNVESIEIPLDFPTENDFFQMASMSCLKYLKFGKLGAKIRISSVLKFLDRCTSLIRLEMPQSILLKSVSDQDKMIFEAVIKNLKIRLI